MIKKGASTKFTGFFIIGIVISLTLFLNFNNAVNMTSQQYVTPTGTTTAIVTTCQPIPIIGTNPLCPYSHISSNSPSPSSDCLNGGNSLNGVCPSSVVALQPVCSASEISQGYIISGTQCIPPLPVCTQQQISDGYVVKGNVCTPPPAEPITITPVALLYDNTGKSQVLTGNTLSYGLFSFIAPKSQNINVDHGKITFAIQLNGKPNTVYQANGTLKVYLDGASLHPLGVHWAINQATDSNGFAEANISLPTGATNLYTFDIFQHASQITLPINMINFTTSDIVIQNVNSGQSFSNKVEQNMLSVELDYSATLSIVSNASGQSTRAYPADDTFTLSSSGKTATFYSQGLVRGTGLRGGAVTETQVTYQPLATGSAQIFVINADGSITPIGFIPSVVGTAGHWVRDAGGDTTGCNESGNSCGMSGSQTISGIPRDSNIQIIISGGASPTTKSYHTPTTPQAYSYSCDNISCGFSP